MTRAAYILLLALICSGASAEKFMPQNYFELRGPCYQPAVALKNFKDNDFELKATANFVNGAGIKSDVLIFKSDNVVVITMTYLDLLCVIVTADELNFGV